MKTVIMLTAITAAIVSLVACNNGKKDDAQTGRPAAKTGPVTPGTSPDPHQGAKVETKIDAKPITLEATDIKINDDANLAAEGFAFDFIVKVNGKAYKKTMTLLGLDGSVYGSSYEKIDNYYVYWMAKCETRAVTFNNAENMIYDESELDPYSLQESTGSCDFVTLTVFATNQAGQKYVQIGMLKNMGANEVIAIMAYPEAKDKDKVVTPAVLTILDIEAKLKSLLVIQ